MECKRCGKDFDDSFSFCPYCGRAVQITHAPKKRGNGQGTVIQLPNGKWKAIYVVSSYIGEDGKIKRHVRTKTTKTKKDAILALPDLQKNPKEESRNSITFKKLFDTWIAQHDSGDSTIRAYNSAVKYFEPLFGYKLKDIGIDELQECVDDCPRGRATKNNMRNVIALMYKYGIPRHVIPYNLNLAQFLKITGTAAEHRISFTADQIEMIRKAIGKVEGAESIYCMIYTGFRPSEFFALTSESYDASRNCLTGGSKTAAGINRIVTLSPKIKGYIAERAAAGGYLFSNNGKPYDNQSYGENVFYPALEEIGIDNPMMNKGTALARHKYTPHSCRHTFATLMKNVAGADKDKMELIGHANGEMLRYYQDVSVADLQKITDLI